MRRKKASLYSFTEDEVPDSEDPRWPGWANLVATHMETPHTAAELGALCSEFSFALLMNVLSWMDLQGRVQRVRGEDGKVRWGLRGPVPPKQFPPVCLVCGGRWVERQAGVVCLKCGRTPGEL